MTFLRNEIKYDRFKRPSHGNNLIERLLFPGPVADSLGFPRLHATHPSL